MYSFSELDFEYSKKKIYNPNNVHTSQEVRHAKLKHSKAGYNAGEEWIIKSNQFTWIVHEYVASKLYQYVLGKELVTDIVLVKSNSSKKIQLAVKMHDNYEKSFKPFSINKNEEFSGVYFLKNEVDGFEIAYTASRVFAEGDDSNYNNYALRLGSNGTKITRFDFDDSFIFFKMDNITPGMTEDSINQKTKDTLAKNGISIDQFIKLADTEIVEPNFGWNSFFRSAGQEYMYENLQKFKQKAKKFIEAFEQILAIDFKQIAELINKGFNDIKELVGDKTFAKYYDIATLNAKLPKKYHNQSNSKKLAFYTLHKIKENFKELGNMLKCLKVEHFLHTNNLSSLEKYLDTEGRQIMKTKCESLYQYSFYETSIQRNVVTLQDLANDYDNAAANFLMANAVHDEL